MFICWITIKVSDKTFNQHILFIIFVLVLVESQQHYYLQFGIFMILLQHFQMKILNV